MTHINQGVTVGELLQHNVAVVFSRYELSAGDFLHFAPVAPSPPAK